MSEVTDGRSTRWEDHRVARRAELVRAASRAVHRYGPTVSMDEIAAFAGTSKSIIYRYFDDRTGLQVAVGSAIVERMHEALSAAARSAVSPRRALRAMVGVYLETIEDSPNVYYFVTRTSAVAGTADDGVAEGVDHVPAPLAAFIDSVIVLIAEPFAEISRTSVTGVAAWAAGAIGFVRATGEWWLPRRHEAGTPDRDALAEQITTWLWSGPVGVLTSDERHQPGNVVGQQSLTGGNP